MIKLTKIVCVLTALCIFSIVANADRGVFKRKANKLHLNINTANTLKNSIQFNLRSGLNYKGSRLIQQQQIGNAMFSTALISYQKGNTVYILPYKQKILIPEFTAASGYKLIIRSKK